MAISRKQNFLGNQRVETSYLKAMEAAVSEDFSSFFNNVFGDGTTNYIIRGFEHNASSNPVVSGFFIDLADSVLASTISDAVIYKFSSSTSRWYPLIGKTIGTFRVGFTINQVTNNEDPQTSKFIDTITKKEITKAVPLAILQSHELVVLSSTDVIPSNTFLLYQVTVYNGVVTNLQLADGTKYFFLNSNGSHSSSLQEWIENIDTGGISGLVAGGDLGGTYPDPTVVGLQTVPVSDATPTAGQVLGYDGSEWKPVSNDAFTNVSHTYYVAVDGNDTTGNGSLTAPFATIAKAQTQSVADYGSTGTPVAIELLPGSYTESVTISRYNTVLRGLNADSRSLSHKIIGSITVDCGTATQKNNNFVAIQGLFIQSATDALTPAVKVNGSGIFSVIIDDCYLTSNSTDQSANAIWVTNDNAQRVRVQVSRSFLSVQKAGPEILQLDHGDIRLDSCEISSSVSSNTASAITLDGDASIFADRLLIDITSTNSVIHVSGTVTVPKLTISNSSLRNAKNTSAAHCISLDTNSPYPVIFSWNNVFTTENSSASAIIGSGASTVVIHGQTTFGPNSLGAMNAKLTGCTLLPMKEMHGDLIIPSIKSDSGTAKALTIDQNGLVGSATFPVGDVASVGHPAGDSSITIGGTGSGAGPWTGNVTLQLPEVITSGNAVGANGVLIPVITYDKYGRLTNVATSPLNIEYTTGQYKTVKQYVDDLAFGLSGKDPVAAATTAAIADAYDVSVDGLVLTKKTGNGALGSIDGITPTQGMRVLIKNEPTAGNLNYNNGIYVVTTVGDGSNKWVLTRSSDANTPTSLCGSLVPVSASGSPIANGGTLWTFAKNPSGFTIGGSAVTFTQIKGVTSDATNASKGVVQLNGAFWNDSANSAAAPTIDLSQTTYFKNALELTKVKGPSSAKAIAYSGSGNDWNANGLTGTSKLVAFDASGNPSVVTTLSGLSFNGSTLSVTASGAVSSISGGVGVTTSPASPATGDVTVSIGQDVAITARPTFAGLTIDGNDAYSVVIGGTNVGDKIVNFDMNATGAWKTTATGQADFNAQGGMHLNDDNTNGGAVTISKSGSTTTIGGILDLKGFLTAGISGTPVASRVAIYSSDSLTMKFGGTGGGSVSGTMDFYYGVKINNSAPGAGNTTIGGGAQVNTTGINSTYLNDYNIYVPNIPTSVSGSKYAKVQSDGKLGVASTIPFSDISNTSFPYDLSGEVVGKPPQNSTFYHFRNPRATTAILKTQFTTNQFTDLIVCDTRTSVDGSDANYFVISVNNGFVNNRDLVKFVFRTTDNKAFVTYVNSTPSNFNIAKYEDVVVRHVGVKDAALANIWFTIVASC